MFGEEDDNKRRRNLMAAAALVLASAFLKLDASALFAAALKVPVQSDPWRWDALALAGLAYFIYRYAMRAPGPDQPFGDEPKAIIIKGWPDLATFVRARQELMRTQIGAALTECLLKKVEGSDQVRARPEPFADRSIFEALQRNAGVQPDDVISGVEFHIHVPELRDWKQDAPPNVFCNMVTQTTNRGALTGTERLDINPASPSYQWALATATLKTGLTTNVAVDVFLPYYIGFAAAAVPMGRLAAALALSLGL